MSQEAASAPHGGSGPAGLVALHDAVTRAARLSPAATAVTAVDGAFTFVELAARSAALTAGLRSAGIGPGDAVGLCLGRSCWLVPSLLAIWAAGATAVPTDDRHPADRISFVLRDADVRLVLGKDDVQGVAPRRALVRHPEALQADGGPQPHLHADPDQCAYVIYTSGTSGWPKGVEVTYRGLDAFLDALRGLGLKPGGLGINAVSPAFDGWLWCTLLGLVHGQGIALVDVANADHGDLAAVIAALRPATVSLTPSLLATCSDDLHGVRTLVVAGEPCPPGLVERAGRGRRMLNVYGPTEATIAATWADSDRGDDVTTIGRPIPGVRAYVLDDEGTPVAPGTPGELHLAGPTLARGYRGRPGQTATSFVADPFAEAGERMYRTGDLVRQRADGQLEFLGRRDAQVKVRGVRVELDEIERVARRLEPVRAAAAYLTATGDAVGLAVVGAGGTGPDVAELVRSHCAEHLPAAMVPAVVHVLDVLPTTPTGKADRHALAGLAPAVRAGRPPATPHERQVCEVYSDLLPQPVRGVDANFFDNGGHSLLATRAVAALRRSTGLRLGMQDFLAHPTPAGLGAALDRLAAAAVEAGAS